MSNEITREELKTKMDRGDRFFLVEVLTNFAYLHGHLPGAINIPLDKIHTLAPDLLPDKEEEIIVYCASFT